MSITRRKFVEDSARAGLALGSSAALGSVAAGSQREKSSAEDGPISIVDTHNTAGGLLTEMAWRR